MSATIHAHLRESHHSRHSRNTPRASEVRWAHLCDGPRWSKRLPAVRRIGKRDRVAVVPDSVDPSIRTHHAEKPDHRAIVVAGHPGMRTDANWRREALACISGARKKYDRLVQLPFDPPRIQIARERTLR